MASREPLSIKIYGQENPLSLSSYDSDLLKQDSFKYTYELVMQLVKPFIEQRNTSKLPWIVKNKIAALVLGRREPITRNEVEQLGPAYEKMAAVITNLEFEFIWQNMALSYS